MHFLGVLLLLVFASCGKSNSNAGLPIEKAPAPLPINGSNIDGLYMAKFFTINTHVNGNLPGSATLQRDGDKFFAYVRLFGGAPNAWHQQNIHEGKRCPNMNDDLNGDGYIDIEEGSRVWGKILIPLDSNLSSQKAGKNIYPMADASGSYFYERVTSFEKMFKDLKMEDKNLDDPYLKLAPEAGFDPVGKVVVIHGTADTVVYPETVASTDRRPPHQTLPIACGVFERVTRIPGEPETEEVPGPVGAPEETPAPAPAPEGEVHQPDPEISVPDSSDGDDTYSPRPRPRSPRSRDERDPWYDRVIDWWRTTWERERAGRRQTWGDGIWEIF